MPKDKSGDLPVRIWGLIAQGITGDTNTYSHRDKPITFKDIAVRFNRCKPKDKPEIKDTDFDNWFNTQSAFVANKGYTLTEIAGIMAKVFRDMWEKPMLDSITTTQMPADYFANLRRIAGDLERLSKQKPSAMVAKDMSVIGTRNPDEKVDRLTLVNIGEVVDDAVVGKTKADQSKAAEREKYILEEFDKNKPQHCMTLTAETLEEIRHSNYAFTAQSLVAFAERMLVVIEKMNVDRKDLFYPKMQAVITGLKKIVSEFEYTKEPKSGAARG